MIPCCARAIDGDVDTALGRDVSQDCLPDGGAADIAEAYDQHVQSHRIGGMIAYAEAASSQLL